MGKHARLVDGDELAVLGFAPSSKAARLAFIGISRTLLWVLQILVIEHWDLMPHVYKQMKSA